MKVCFVGYGSIGKRHIKNLRSICTENGESPEIHLLRSSGHMSQDVDGDKEFYDISQLDDKYDMIFITNPTFLHLETLKKLIDYSECFFVEKPVFDSIDVDYGFITNEKNVYVACPLRHTGVIRNLSKIINIDDVFCVRAICSSYLPDWRPGTDYRKVYSAHKDEGGGVRIDLIHEWDYLTYLFGFPEKIESIAAKTSGLEIDSEDLAVYIARDKKRVIELHLDYFGRIPKRECELYTDEKEYVVDLNNNTISENGKMIFSTNEDVNERYINEMRYFLSFYERKTGNINDVENAVRVMRLAMH